MFAKHFKNGQIFIYITSAALGLILLMLCSLIVVVCINGLGVLWPAKIALAELNDKTYVMGEIITEEKDEAREIDRIQFKVGNRDLYGQDFRWIDRKNIKSITYPDQALALEREEYGNFYGWLATPFDSTEQALQSLEKNLSIARKDHHELEVINENVSSTTRATQKLEHKKKVLKHKGKDDPQSIAALDEQIAVHQKNFDKFMIELNTRKKEAESKILQLKDSNGKTKEMPYLHVVRVTMPNHMSMTEKLLFYSGKIKELFFGEPRESNTEGGLFPAIFGTVMLIFVMSIASFPLGVLAGIYLKEYSKDGLLVRTVRIAVNNLAGIPSIVFGIFGLGFFIYGIGGAIDHLFFPEQLPTPTFGTGGLLWASLTLGLLTVPVVIVSTEEALGVIPQGVREGSFALGATKFQTLVRVLLPMASPGILTGFILAMSRAAGEVAPLMITGVVKLAPALPLDGEFPFLHLDRKFMHLGFHIYDVGFQSPNVEAAKPMVFVTTLLLLGIVIVMSSGAIVLRNRMKKKFTSSTL